MSALFRQNWARIFAGEEPDSEITEEAGPRDLATRHWMSLAVGCHRSQVNRKNKQLRDRGITDHEYNKRGYLESVGKTSMIQQRRMTRKLGLVNYDDFLG